MVAAGTVIELIVIWVWLPLGAVVIVGEPPQVPPTAEPTGTISFGSRSTSVPPVSAVVVGLRKYTRMRTG